MYQGSIFSEAKLKAQLDYLDGELKVFSGQKGLLKELMLALLRPGESER